MSSNINKINVKGLIREDGYCRLANIPEMFCEIAEDAGKQLINYIMQKFLDGKLSKDLKIDCQNLESWLSIPNSEPMIINVNDYKQVLKKYISNQKWKSIVDAINDDPTSEFYKTYIDQNKLMIHIDDVVVALQDWGLKKIGKEISSILDKKAAKKKLKQKRDWKIIRLEQKIKKMSLGDHKSAEEILKFVNKDKKTKGDSIKINKEISNLNIQTIANIISKYYSKLINKSYEEHLINNKIKVQHIITGIESREKEKENKTQVIELRLPYKKGYCYYNGKEEFNNNTHIIYEDNKEFIDGLYKRHSTKPTVEQVVEALEEEFIKFTAKELKRPEYSVRSIISNIREKKQLIEIEYLTTGEKLLDKISEYMDVFSRDDLKQAVKFIPDKEIQERLIEEALADKSVKILNEQYNRYNTNNKDQDKLGIKIKDIISLKDNSESNEPKKYIRITKFESFDIDS
mgnify:CR=1 FL=1